MCFKHQPLERSCQSLQVLGLSFLAISKKKTAFSKPVTVYAFQIYAEERLRISSFNLSQASCPDHSGAAPEI